jgi:hypothetical protein
MSILIEERGKRYEYYVNALRDQFGDLDSLVYACNKEVFLLRKNQTEWFQSLPLNKIQPGRFYLINYNFNDNRLYCPVFVIDYRVSKNNKHNIYAINLDYLPFDYKKIYFNELYNLAEPIFIKNADAQNVLSEASIPVNFENIYKSLEKNGGYNYAISAFDVTKITECYLVSTNLMYLITHVHMRPINIALMKELSERYDKGNETKDKLEILIEELENTTLSYDTDVKDFYKKLRNLENNYKLFDE